MVAAATRIAYAQVDNFLGLLEQKYIDMIPRNIRFFIKQEKDENYDKQLYADIPMKDQEFSDEALAVIAYLNLNYWCQDKEEKERLLETYTKNDERYEEENKKIQHGADEIFGKESDDKIVEDDEQELHLIKPSKDGLIRRIILRIKSFFLK